MQEVKCFPSLNQTHPKKFTTNSRNLDLTDEQLHTCRLAYSADHLFPTIIILSTVFRGLKMSSFLQENKEFQEDIH